MQQKFCVKDSERQINKPFFNTFFIDDEYVLSVCSNENEAEIKNVELYDIKNLIK